MACLNQRGCGGQREKAWQAVCGTQTQIYARAQRKGNDIGICMERSIEGTQFEPPASGTRPPPCAAGLGDRDDGAIPGEI